MPLTTPTISSTIEHPSIVFLHNLPAPLEWSCPTTSGAAPAPRQGHILAVVGSKLFVHGGMAGQEIFSDLHTLDLGELLTSFPGPVQLTLQATKSCTASNEKLCESWVGDVVNSGY